MGGPRAGRSEKGVTSENSHHNLMSGDNLRERVQVLALVLFLSFMCACQEHGLWRPSCLGSSPGSATGQLGGLGHLASHPRISVCVSVKSSY